jgi:hypothetical protein
MFADRGLRKPNVLDEVTYPMLAGRKVLQHRQAGTVTERLEQVRIDASRLLIEHYWKHAIHRHNPIVSLFSDDTSIDKTLDQPRCASAVRRRR